MTFKQDTVYTRHHFGVETVCEYYEDLPFQKFVKDFSNFKNIQYLKQEEFFLNYHLAIDIGASSGRHILGWMDNGVLKLKEIFRFDNNVIDSENGLIWDIEHLVQMVKDGIKECSKHNVIPTTVAIDTWAVDYLLLDKDGKEIYPAFAYRNNRTSKVVPMVESIIPPEELYARSGLQKQEFNTIYQLYYDQLCGRLEGAEKFVMIPAYLSYKLTGICKNEYTNASTTQLVNAQSKDWDFELIDRLGLPHRLFDNLCMPTEVIGDFTPEMQEYVGFNSTVIFCPSHDTASAVAACPIIKDGMYISSGTWSLVGMENQDPILTNEARKYNFTNEGGIEYRFRFLKNYMGMWLMQNIRRNLNKELTYDQMMNLAMESGEYHYIDVNHPSFTAPENMINAIRKYLNQPELPLGVVINSVYHSLAKSYVTAVEEMEKVTGKTVSCISIVGGGCMDTYLNSLTAKYTGKTVTSGPVEATAIGNLISQVMYLNSQYSLEDMRETVKKSFDIQEVK